MHHLRMDVDYTDIDVIRCQFRTMNTNDKDNLINEFKRLSNTKLSNDGCCFYLDLAEWNLNTALWAYYEYEVVSLSGSASSSSSSSLNVPASTSGLSNILPSTVFLSSSSLSSSSSSSSSASPARSLAAAPIISSLFQNNTATPYNNYQLIQQLPQMRFVCDLTLGKDKPVGPHETCKKTWRIVNTGVTRWPSNCLLKYVNGFDFDVISNDTKMSKMSSHMSLLDPDGITPIEPSQKLDISIQLRSPPSSSSLYECQLKLYTQFGQPFGDPIWLVLKVEDTEVLNITRQLNSVNVFGIANGITSGVSIRDIRTNNADSQNVKKQILSLISDNKPPFKQQQVEETNSVFFIENIK